MDNEIQQKKKNFSIRMKYEKTLWIFIGFNLFNVKLTDNKEFHFWSTFTTMKSDVKFVSVFKKRTVSSRYTS